MPWTPQTASKHKKGMSPHQSKVWAKVANKNLRRGEGSAIRIANSAVNKMHGGGTADAKAGAGGMTGAASPGQMMRQRALKRLMMGHRS